MIARRAAKHHDPTREVWSVRFLGLDRATQRGATNDSWLAAVTSHKCHCAASNGTYMPIGRPSDTMTGSWLEMFRRSAGSAPAVPMARISMPSVAQ
jgi:hypothetical protein